MSVWMMYSANRSMGELMVREARMCALSPILARRNARALTS
jgi:hypothetical protein